MKFKKKFLPVAVSLLLGSSLANAQSYIVNLENRGFENGMKGWIEKDPASISSVAHGGARSLKISGSPGRVSQFVDIENNTKYQLQAWVRGKGLIFINAHGVGPKFKGKRFDVDEWTLVKFTFQSGNAARVELGAKHRGSDDDVRFDNFTLINLTEKGGSPTPTPVATPTPTPVSTPAPTPVATPTPTSTGDFGLNPNAAPSENFNLSEWNLGVPDDNDRNGRSDTIKVRDLNDGYQSEFFYTGADGGLVFKNYIDGPKTSTNTSYTRSELREILGGDENAGEGDTDVGEVNWVFSTAPSRDRAISGGVDGVLQATLAVNHVTTTGRGIHPGRVIIGQIHAKNNEPCRLYYRKLPGNTHGSIYFAHETRDGDEFETNLIGSESSSQDNPGNGIRLDEVFSYEINAQGDDLTVSIIREGKATISRTIDMSDSGYDKSGEYMYFKAGVYTQNNTGEDDDYDQATFYEINTFH